MRPVPSPAPSPAARRFLDAVELLIPERLEGPDPVVNRLEAFGVQRVEPLLARATHGDKTDFPQDAQVLGDLRLGQAERRDHVVDRLLALGEQVENLPTSRFGDGVEGVRGRWRSCHARIIYPNGNISRAVPGFGPKAVKSGAVRRRPHLGLGGGFPRAGCHPFPRQCAHSRRSRGTHAALRESL